MHITHVILNSVTVNKSNSTFFWQNTYDCLNEKGIIFGREGTLASFWYKRVHELLRRKRGQIPVYHVGFSPTSSARMLWSHMTWGVISEIMEMFNDPTRKWNLGGSLVYTNLWVLLSENCFYMYLILCIISPMHQLMAISPHSKMQRYIWF